MLGKTDFTNLQYLSIQLCLIGQEGIKHLNKINCPKLKQITLEKDKVMFNGLLVLYLFNSKYLRSITMKDGVAIGLLCYAMSIDSKNCQQNKFLDYGWTKNIGNKQLKEHIEQLIKTRKQGQDQDDLMHLRHQRQFQQMIVRHAQMQRLMALQAARRDRQQQR